MAEAGEDANVATASSVKESNIKLIQKIERLSLRWNHRTQQPIHAEFSQEAISANPEKTVCFVSADIGMGSDLLTMKVAKRLEELLPKQKDSGKPLCHIENLSIRYASLSFYY